MSEPFLHAEDKIQGALNETVSAISALNMPPEPMAKPIDKGFYLSERDSWAAHCMEHLRAVCQLLNEAYQDREKLRHRIWQLEVKLAETRIEHKPAPEKCHHGSCNGTIQALVCDHCYSR